MTMCSGNAVLAVGDTVQRDRCPSKARTVETNKENAQKHASASSTDNAIRFLEPCCLGDLLVSFPCSFVGNLRIVVNRVNVFRLPRHDLLQILEGFVHLYHAAVNLDQ